MVSLWSLLHGNFDHRWLRRLTIPSSTFLYLSVLLHFLWLGMDDSVTRGDACVIALGHWQVASSPKQFQRSETWEGLFQKDEIKSDPSVDEDPPDRTIYQNAQYSHPTLVVNYPGQTFHNIAKHAATLLFPSHNNPPTQLTRLISYTETSDSHLPIPRLLRLKSLQSDDLPRLDPVLHLHERNTTT